MINVSRSSILEYGTHLRSLGTAGDADDDLRRRVELLLPADRALATLVMRGQASHRQIASLMKCTPGTVSRLIRRLSNRLHDPRVIALLHPQCPLEPEYRHVGVERFLQGKSIKAIAAAHELSPREVRRRIEAINFWYRGLAARRVVSSR